MIRRLAILAVAAIHLAASNTDEKSIDEKAHVVAQKTVFDLLWHVDQPDKVHPEIYKLGTSWDIEDNVDLYTDKLVVKEFLQRYHHGMLPRGQIFSVFYPHLLDEAVALFKLFRSAGDLDTFFKTAAWARIHMNEGQFVYAFYIAVIHLPYGVRSMRLPLPYEIMPNYFFNKDVMQKAYDYKSAVGCHGTENGTTEPYIVMANYTHWYASNSRDPETKLSYYLEDVGLNAYYFFNNQEFPFWMSSAEYKLPGYWRGEYYYYYHKILLNRYRMERYSLGLDEIEDFDLAMPITTGYSPSMTYRNGLEFPQRKERSMVPAHEYSNLRRAKEFETRVVGAIDYGYYVNKAGKSEGIFTQKGFNMIANIIQGNADSSHRTFYGSVDHSLRSVFGFSPEFQSKYQVVPSALQHYSTSLRDPAFYRIYKRILSYFELYKQHLDYYTHDEFALKGVEIESVAIDKLSTYFDSTDSLISNGVRVHDHRDAESFIVKARQYRLNHKPFTYHLTIKSDKKSKVYVTIFLGPKYNIHGKEMDISESFERFFEIDYFIVDLTTGINKVERNSTEAVFTVPDYESSDVFYKRIQDAISTGTGLPVDDKVHGLPNRLILPKGKADGLPVRFCFYVGEIDEKISEKVKFQILGEWDYDTKAFGFPLDRPMHAYNFTAPNMLFKDAVIFHEDN